MTSRIGNEPPQPTFTGANESSPARVSSAASTKKLSPWMAESKDLPKYAATGSSWSMARFASALRRQFDSEEARDYEGTVPLGMKTQLLPALRNAVDSAAVECLERDDAQCIKNLYWAQAVAGAVVRPLSGRFLRHYLDGTGTPMGPPVRMLSKMPGVKAFQSRTFEMLTEQLRYAAPGTSVTGERREPSIDYDGPDYREYLAAYGEDMVTASGHFNLSAKYEAEVQERAGKRVLVVDVKWGFEDRYHWWKDNPTHDSLRYLKDVGVAKEFDVRTQWTTRKQIPL